MPTHKTHLHIHMKFLLHKRYLYVFNVKPYLVAFTVIGGNLPGM